MQKDDGEIIFRLLQNMRNLCVNKICSFAALLLSDIFPAAFHKTVNSSK